MRGKREHLAIGADLSDVFMTVTANGNNDNVGVGLDVLKALDIVIKQMETEGLRPRTISDYTRHVSHYVKVTGVTALTDINSASIYEWLGLMKVAPQTKLIRLKCFKAFLGRCHDNGWLIERFWRQIKIKVDVPVKEGATEAEVYALLRQLDLTDFVQLRDAVALLMIFQTGIRLATISALESRHVDIDAKMLRLDGALLKNREVLILPFDDTLARILKALMDQNAIIRAKHNKRNDFVFITIFGNRIASSDTSNNIAKRLNLYKRQYGLENINAHALRRGFAKSIYKKSGGDMALVSNALGHSDYAITTRYLHLGVEEVASDLRKLME